MPEIGGIRNIALDRTLEMEKTDEDFVVPDDFDAEMYYAHTVGIFVNENLKPQKVVLRAYGVHVDYMRSLPLHFSQKEIKTIDGEYSDFQFSLCLTPELTTKILSMGEKVEVIEPEVLRKEVLKRLYSTIRRYSENKIKI